VPYTVLPNSQRVEYDGNLNEVVWYVTIEYNGYIADDVGVPNDQAVNPVFTKYLMYTDPGTDITQNTGVPMYDPTYNPSFRCWNDY
jgi:hypothetical protein